MHSGFAESRPESRHCRKTPMYGGPQVMWLKGTHVGLRLLLQGQSCIRDGSQVMWLQARPAIASVYSHIPVQAAAGASVWHQTKLLDC